MTTPSTNDPIGIAHPSRCPHRLVRRPPSSSTTAPMAGSATTSHSSVNSPSASAGTTGTPASPEASGIALSSEVAHGALLGNGGVSFST